MEKCPDKNAKVEFTIRSVLVSANADGTETVSMASAAMSCDSGPESEFDFNELGEEPSGGNNRNARRLKRGLSDVKGSNILVSLQQKPVD